MIANAFIILCTSISLIFCLFIFLKQKKWISLLPITLMVIFLPIFALSGLRSVEASLVHFNVVYLELYILSALFIQLGILESIQIYYRPKTAALFSFGDNSKRKSLLFSSQLWRFIVIGCVLLGTLAPQIRPFIGSSWLALSLLNNIDSMIVIIRFLLDLTILFALENIYRYCQPYKRRIARLSFIAFALLAVFDAVFSIRLVLYSALTREYVEASVIVYGVCIATGLFGLIRHRMATENFVISRMAVQSSITLILSIVLLLILGLTVFIMQQFGIRFAYFETFLAVFSMTAFIILGASSSSMRLRIARLVNRTFYRHKYDYRDQFFRLHQTYLAGEKLEDSVNILLENLVHTVGIGEVIVFIRNDHDGNYYLHCTPESELETRLSIRGDSPLVTAFLMSEEPCFFKGIESRCSERESLAAKEVLVEKHEIAAVFPIQQGKVLAGLLAIKKMRDRELDDEDLNLIKVFAISIGNVFVKYRLLEERLEYKQFESFHHISSFIIHDIKNQVATLSLVLRNAEKNITNPDFQKSLLTSVGSCAGNLQTMIDKLSIPSRQQEPQRRNEAVKALLSEVIENSGLRTVEGIALSETFSGTLHAFVDKSALFYIVKNLIVNAIEAMNGVGTLAIIAGDTAAMPLEIKNRFDIGGHLLSKTSVYILIKDTGQGMTRQFMEEKLFRPFSSTKDKGIGIGLYQCKVLVEQMGGALLCYSHKGVGSEFCVVI